MKFSYHILLLFTILFFGISQVFPRQDSPKRPKIGLVLSGGGAKGFAHIGVIKVLEEAGLRPDYIAGTSMGGIVGGLYAIGYSSDSLENLAKTTPWNYYLTDDIPRKNIAFEEKEDRDRFVLSFRIEEKKIQIPSGVVRGQNIENILNKLCAPVYDIRDFNEFNIPFLCVATDITNGKEVVLKNGYLPDALRATMSIPSIFHPTEIDNKLLVDGGLVDNLPAERLKEMGADIIIGVDVGFQYYTKDELNSLFKIIEQSLYFYGEEQNTRNKELCDILIKPELFKFNSSSFNSADSIIALGEIAARKIFPGLKALADSINGIGPDLRAKPTIPTIDSLQFTEIKISGLEKVSPKLVTGKLQLTPLVKVTTADLEKAVERVYSSLYFDNISYKIDNSGTGTELRLNLTESNGGLLRLGVHYDSDYKAALLLNTTFRNVIINGSKLSINTALGQNPYFRASLIKNNGWKPGPGINFEYNRNQMFLYRDSKKISSINYSEIKLQIFTQSTFGNFLAVGTGIELENAMINPVLDPVLGIEKHNNSFINYFGYLLMDSYDNPFYPTQGIKINSRIKFITSSNTYDPVIFAAGQISLAGKISERMTLIGHMTGGVTFGDTIPPQYLFYAGGLRENMRNGIMPFVGLNYIETSNENGIIGGLDCQMRFWKNMYFILRANVGNLKKNWSTLLNPDELMTGYGMTFGYDSFIGPIEFTLSKSSNRSGINSFVRIGFYF